MNYAGDGFVEAARGLADEGLAKPAKDEKLRDLASRARETDKELGRLLTARREGARHLDLDIGDAWELNVHACDAVVRYVMENY